MREMVMKNCLWISLLLELGCVKPPPLYCEDASVCGAKTNGICVRTAGIPGACALPDQDCPSKYRYYKDSGFGRDSQCAQLSTYEIQPQFLSVNEHQIFSMHVIAKDSAGEKITDFNGKPEISADWGDARVFSSTPFVNGEADYTLWLNRETNPQDGQEHIVVKDGSSLGRSQGIDVKVKSWERKGIRGVGKSEITNATTIGRIGVDYVFFFQSADNALRQFRTGDLFYSSSEDPSSTLILEKSNIPWTNNGVYTWGSPAHFKGYDLLSYNTERVETGFPFSGILKSKDGVTWTNLSTTPLSTHEISGEGICAIVGVTSSILSDSEKPRLYYISGIDPKVTCSADSMDEGLTWINGRQNKGVPAIYVFKEGSIFRSAGLGGQLATSRDGTNWVNTPTPLQEGFADDVLFTVWAEDLRRYVGIRTKDNKTVEVYTRE